MRALIRHDLLLYGTVCVFMGTTTSPVINTPCEDKYDMYNSSNGVLMI